VRTWVAAEVPDAEDGWEEDAEYEITAMKRPERRWAVGVDVPVSSGTLHVELSVGGEGDGSAAGTRSMREDMPSLIASNRSV
jgi:hypothetical protein